MAKSPRQLDRDSIYDQGGTDPSDPRDSLKQKENVSDIPAEQLERIPTMSDEEGKQLDKKRGLADDGGAPTTEQLAQSEEAGGQPSYYRPVQPKKSWLGAKGVGTRNPYRRYLIFGGVGAGIIALIIALISFLGIFKLDGLMSNIEQRAFLRHNASLNTRSSKWISAYIEARMLQVGDGNDNVLFRSNKVDTNSPFTDWYRTLRTSNFEQDVFNKHGIQFTSVVGLDGKARFGKITVKGENPIDITTISNEDISKIIGGDPAALAKYESLLSIDTLDSNKAARATIKDVVNANTHWTQVYKRRFLRKNIQNMTGVKDWKFFETSRDKVQDKKIDIRNRILNSMLPDNSQISKVVRCFVGLSNCTANRDVASETNRASATDVTTGDSPDNQDPKEADKEVPAELDAAGISDALKKILVAANVFNKLLSIPQTLNMLSAMQKSISNLAKLVVVVRGAQAAGLFQVFETSRDQIKSGQVTGEEVNALMENIDTAGNSAGYSQVIAGDGAAPGTTQTGGQCSQDAQALEEKQPQAYLKKYGPYSPLCADQQIGSVANAQKIQDDYNATIGKIVGPIVSAWEGAKDTPILGQFIDAFTWLGNLFSKFTNAIIDSVLKALGLDGQIKKVIAWVFAKMSNFLGLSILKGYESGGTIFNWLVQGGAYTAESSTRMDGGALTTPAAQAAAQSTIAQYQTYQRQQSSLYDKVASLDDPNSLAFKGATNLETIKADPSTALMSGVHNLFGGIAKNFGSIFSGKLYAATPNGYTASQFANIETYDYPQKCYDLDPITAKPIEGTNAMDVFANPGAYGVNKPPIIVKQAQSDELNSWVVESDSNTFYDTIYAILKSNGIRDNADDIAVHIYNCNLLDTVTRGSLGYLYGYTKGNGL